MPDLACGCPSGTRYHALNCKWFPGEEKADTPVTRADVPLLMNACEQALLLLGRKRFEEDAEAEVVRAVLRGALR